ncbi:BRO-N domain-containing protein [Psychrobacter sp. T6-6]|uniref:BRO-N domain-containing protein n=1 Tax=Psychrobacter sp. T6-6 TaxID=3457452 RepID=UPI003FD26609
MNTLTFNETTFNPVERNGQIWLTSIDLAKALGYKSTKSVSNLYSNNSDEFTDQMTLVIESVTNGISGSKRKMSVRIFSLRGCHAIGFFARTKIAKQFRKWVLDILDKEVGAPVQVFNNQLTAEQTLPLRNAVNKLVGKSGIMYPEGYKIVHQRFGVKHIKDLTLEQLSQAVEYVHDRILSLNVESTPISSFTHNQYIMGVKHEVMDYVYSLQRTIVNSGNKLPSYPDFDKEEICRAFMASMIQSNRMMLSFDHNGKPNIGFIPQEHAVVSRESLSSVVQFADRSQLPSIINEAVERLGK